MNDLCMTDYIMVNHGTLNEFVGRWHSKTSSFHLLLDEMSITLDDVSCLLHLPIRGRLIDHGRITKDEALEMMGEYLGIDPAEADEELNRTIGLMLGLNT